MNAIRAGIAALAALSALVAGAFAGLILEGAASPARMVAAFDPYLFRVVRFTLLQAVLSTLVSVLPALLVARALSRHPRFPGRTLLLRLFAVPLALPALVAALGVLALFGRSGWLGHFLAATGGRWEGIYGLSGILVAHAFFNMPLATRLFLQALDAVPADQWRLAAQLGMGPSATFRLIEWPALRQALPGVAGLVFMLCVTSFTIVLLLGGGPAATTLEVAIYQSLRFDFDPPRALALTLLQLALTLVSVWLLTHLGAAMTPDAGLTLSPRRYGAPGPVERSVNAAVIAAALLFVAGPLIAIAISGLSANLARLAGEDAVRRAALTSLVLATVAAILAVAASWALAAGRNALAGHRKRSASLLARTMEAGPASILVVPAIVIGAGWFILLRRFADAFALAPAMVIAVNAAMAVPFVMRVLKPAHDAAAARHNRLCAQLGIAGLDRLRHIDLPALKGPLATGLAFAMALSLGDLGVIALFGSDQVQTLPYLLYARLGSYRTEDAAGLALLLGLVCLALMVAVDRGSRESR